MIAIIRFGSEADVPPGLNFIRGSVAAAGADAFIGFRDGLVEQCDGFDAVTALVGQGAWSSVRAVRSASNAAVDAGLTIRTLLEHKGVESLTNLISAFVLIHLAG